VREALLRTILRVASPTELIWKGEFSEDGKAWKSSGEGKTVK
jgi:hypothetical protein